MSKASTVKSIVKKMTGASKATDVDAAKKLLEQYNDVDVATKLVGSERAEYLKALDTVYGPRDVRAKNLGFSDTKLYHGSNENIDKFIPSSGDAYDSARYGQGAYFYKDSARGTGHYSEGPGGNVTQAVSRAKNLRKMDDTTFYHMTKEVAEEYAANNGGKYPSPAEAARLATEKLKAEGVEGAIDTKKRIVSIYDPAQIRSTNAAFDPRFKKSSNILAGAAGLTAAGAATFGGANQAEASPSSAIAKRMAKSASKEVPEALKPNSLETLERLLPSGSDDKARELLRSNPEQYKQYLNALDEAYGTREARAKKLGFSDKTYYHGTRHLDGDIEKFDLEKADEAAGENIWGRGVYVSDNPKVASTYTSGVKVGRSGGVYPLKVRGEIQDLDTVDGVKNDAVNQGLTFRGSQNAVIRDPKDLRSVNAAYDPRFKDSADILALNDSGKKALKPGISVTGALSKLMGLVDKVDKPVNDAVKLVSDKFAEQTNLVPKSAQSPTTELAENLRRGAIETGLGFVAPTPSSIAMGGAGKLLKLGNGAAIASKMAQPAKPAVVKSAAEIYREAKAASKGVVVVPSAADKAVGNFGTVTVKP